VSGGLSPEPGELNAIDNLVGDGIGAQSESKFGSTSPNYGDSALTDRNNPGAPDSRTGPTKPDCPENSLQPSLLAPPKLDENEVADQAHSRSSDAVGWRPVQSSNRQDLARQDNSPDPGSVLQTEPPGGQVYEASGSNPSTFVGSVSAIEPDSISRPGQQTHDQLNVSAAAGEAQGVDQEPKSTDHTLYDVKSQEKHTLLNVRRLVGELQKEKIISESIHILGTGTVGRFIAHSLVGIAEAPPVTLLLHRPLLVQQWYDEGGSIKLIKNNEIDFKSKLNIESSAPFHTGAWDQVPKSSTTSNTIIENLIVTTGGPETISALSAIKHRLRHYSTICFIQDGMGIIDRVNASVFSRPSSRPSYMLGNITHDLQSTGSTFTVFERRPGTLSLTIIPPNSEITGQVRKLDTDFAARSRYLIRTLCRAPELRARGLIPRDFYIMQLERLAISSVLEPLSVVYNCTNDQLLYNFEVSRAMTLLLKEISLIIWQLPEVSYTPDIDRHFSPERLEAIIVSVIAKTGKNRTSMLQAVMDGKRTNIDFHSGYLLGRARQLGIDCPNLEMMVAIVKGKQAMISREKNSYIPFEDA
jgi:2-dehydropantoate 2-reductase